MERLRDVTEFEVGVLAKDLVVRHSISDHSDESRNGEPEITDAADAAHLVRRSRDACELHLFSVQIGRPPPDDVSARGPSPGAYGASVDLGPLIDHRAGARIAKPCFVGTRIAVVEVLDQLAAGMTAAEIVVDFPELTVDHVQAAVVFAADRARPLASPS